MNSRTTHSFREAFKVLPLSVKQRARAAYKLWRANPNLPGLRFKRLGDEVSVRIGHLAGRHRLLVLDWQAR